MLDQLQVAYEAVKAQNLKLNMARGKPSSAQLDLSMPMLGVLGESDVLHASDGTDVRNYGVGQGIPEARNLMAAMMNDVPENVIVCGNSSLNIMYDCIARYWTFGALGSRRWCELDAVKWICPVPGYDRHFSITEAFGIEMIPVPMDDCGPDMDLVEQLVADEAVKGIWCVPQYANPSGITYSDGVVNRLASMKCAAEDFRIFWDNAYCVHDLYEDKRERVADIALACEKAGTPDRYIKFVSTSKITFPGAGLAALAASPANIDEISKRMSVQTIGHDKINQLRHVRFLRDAHGIETHMKAHAAIIAPKFDLVLDRLQELEAWDCSWSRPQGGYFICFTGPKGTATRTVELAAEAGVTLTGAGAPFPYGNDPNDAVIRIAPTLPPLDELEQAIEVFCLCVKLSCAEAGVLPVSTQE